MSTKQQTNKQKMEQGGLDAPEFSAARPWPFQQQFLCPPQQ